MEYSKLPLIFKVVVHNAVSYTHLDVYKRQAQSSTQLLTSTIDRLTICPHHALTISADNREIKFIKLYEDDVRSRDNYRLTID